MEEPRCHKILSRNAKQKNTRILSRAGNFILEHLTKREKPANRDELAAETQH
ncbi:exoribonuclease R [Citrobacter braakii]|nr:exoribonuclease R [Citrobacter braakii]